MKALGLRSAKIDYQPFPVFQSPHSIFVHSFMFSIKTLFRTAPKTRTETLKLRDGFNFFKLNNLNKTNPFLTLEAPKEQKLKYAEKQKQTKR